ncbi:MAG: hypothetical protein MJA30_33505 [Cytophagales bacterium]|nr:hypothetical protein [Cytophagales bacterium]
MVNKIYDPSLPLFSLHTPKCGGTSFRQLLEAWFGNKLKLHYFNEELEEKPSKLSFTKKTFFGVRNRRKMCIHGHFNNENNTGVFDYYPDASQFITLIRDPAEIHISTYFFYKKLLGYDSLFINGIKMSSMPYESIDEYLENHNSYLFNYFPWHIHKDNYESIVNDGFLFIGTMEKYQKSITYIAHLLGKKLKKIPHTNVSRRDESASASSIKTFQEKNALEYMFFDQVCRNLDSL